jgi:hypothetical protein
MANERLRSAMAKAQADIEAITQATGVDPKTAQRWLNGRIPHPRHRWAIAHLLGEDEGYLWPAARPDLSPGAEATSEVVAAYGHRVELRFHNVHLYNAIYRFDDEIIVTPYLYRAHGFQHPAFRLRRLGPYGVFASFADQFETIWATAAPAQNPVSLANEREA